MQAASFSIFAFSDVLDPEERRQRRRLLARMGLAWLLMMQVMMLAFPAYLHESPSAGGHGFLGEAIGFMNWLSLILTLPVVWYCAVPVWQGAWSRMRQRRVTMDVPVALGIAAAFIPSAYATWVRHGEVYFESVCMFVAFLLTARYLELCAAQASRHAMDAKAGAGGDPTRGKHALMQRADRIAVWFTVIQIALSLLAGAVWFVLAPEHALAVMIAMLVISCPCALAMAVPVAVAAGQSRLAAQAELASASPATRSIWQATQRCARQNLTGALIWHVLMMPLAAVGWVQPWLAALTMLASSLAVALNGWRLFRY